MDALRLGRLCSADITLILIQWSDSGVWIIPDFDNVHTCRGYDALKEWLEERNAALKGKWYEKGGRMNLQWASRHQMQNFPDDIF
jgi:hypothetical protein